MLDDPRAEMKLEFARGGEIMSGPRERVLARNFNSLTPWGSHARAAAGGLVGKEWRNEKPSTT